jgi:hypothetical protein
MESLLPVLRAAFEASVVINTAVLLVLLAGLGLAIAQAAALRPVRHWVDQASRGFSVKEPPALIAPLARVLAGKERDGFVLSLSAMGALLDGVRRRVEEARYVAGQALAALAFLTLIGAFWSAAQIGAASLVILGLASLLVRRAQSRALREVEDFLAQRAELPSALLGGESALPAYVEALLKQTAENLSEIQRMMIRTEEERRATQAALGSLTETLAAVSDQLRAQQKVILTLSKNHYDLQPAIADLATQVAGALAGSEEMRSHLRNVDLSVTRLVDEVSAARAQTPEAMRQEIKVLAQTLAHGRNGDRPHFSASAAAGRAGLER